MATDFSGFISLILGWFEHFALQCFLPLASLSLHCVFSYLSGFWKSWILMSPLLSTFIADIQDTALCIFLFWLHILPGKLVNGHGLSVMILVQLTPQVQTFLLSFKLVHLPAYLISQLDILQSSKLNMLKIKMLQSITHPKIKKSV